MKLKWHRRVKGGVGGGMLSFRVVIRGGKRRGGEHAELQSSDSWGGRGGLTLEKEEGFQFQTSHRMNGKTGGKNH